MDFWYGFAKAILWAYLTIFAEVIHLGGEENKPSGAKIIAANHPPSKCHPRIELVANTVDYQKTGRDRGRLEARKRLPPHRKMSLKH
jgi:hypothetical protein